MPTSAQASLSDERRSAGMRNVSRIRYIPAYDVSTYIRYSSVYFDTHQLSMLPTSGYVLTVPFRLKNRDMEDGAWRKCWKHSARRCVFTLNVSCSEMNSTFVRCHEEDRYQQRLATLLAEVHRRSTVSTIVATALLCSAEDFGHL